MKSGNGGPSVRGAPHSNAEELAQAWLRWVVDIKGRSLRTFEAYSLTLVQWFRWCEARGVDPLNPDVTDLEEWTLRPRTRQGHGKVGAPATRRAEIVAIRGWFEWMVRRGHIAEDPTLDLVAPSVKRKLPKPVPDEHWQQLIRTDMTERLWLTLSLAYYTGLRRAELASLTGSQVTPELILNFPRKGGVEDTLPWRELVGVYVQELPQLTHEPERFVDKLQEYARAAGRGPLLYKEGQTIGKEMKRACKRAGIPHYTPHQLRDSCATNLLRAEMPIEMVASMLNHASIEMTRGYARQGGTELAEWRRKMMLRG